MYKERKVMTKVDTIAEMSKRYQNGKIYKISSLECDGPCYIGATCTKYLSTRLRKHKENFKTWQNKGCTGKYKTLENKPTSLTDKQTPTI